MLGILTLLKVIQLYETMLVRHGVMLVGGTMGGKTTCYRALASALTALSKKENNLNENYRKVHTYVLNPKVLITLLNGIKETILTVR